MLKKTLYFDTCCGYTMSAVTEGGKLTEFDFERTAHGVAAGNIYKGRVESVLPGMQAAFINCGLERNCYLSADDLMQDSEKYESHSQNELSFPELKEGDEILVQVTKPPIGSKGARVTTMLSFVGKSIIYMPESGFIGVSRKIADDELRKNLIFSAERLVEKGEGLVLRTAAPYTKRQYIEAELGYMRNLYKGILKAYKKCGAGTLLYTDSNLPIRVLRDTLSYDIEKIIVGSKELEKTVNSLMGTIAPYSNRKIVLHDNSRDLLTDVGLYKQILEMTSPKVNLDNGAYLVIEKTEALTVIDVNTGKFTGDYNLEQTVYHTNIMAAREIARQVKLRNIGGIVVVDFIDMQTEAHKKSLVSELERALSNDKSKCAVSPMTKLGLVEFSRKRIGASTALKMCRPCKHCRGTGHVKSAEFIIFGIRAEILSLAADGAAAVRIDMNAEILSSLESWEELICDLKARCPKTEVFAVAHKNYDYAQVNFRLSTDPEFSLPDGAVKLI